MSDDSFERDAPERSSSSAGVKMLRERLEQQNREVHTHLAPPVLAAASLLLDRTQPGCPAVLTVTRQAHGTHVTRSFGKNAGVLNQSANSKVRFFVRPFAAVPVPGHQR
jgi:hypothetical protein